MDIQLDMNQYMKTIGTEFEIFQCSYRYYSMVNSSWTLPWNYNCHSNSYGYALQYWFLLLACVRISEHLNFKLNVAEKWVCIHNQYLYTPSIHQKAWESRHTYGKIIMLLVPFHRSVHNDRISKLI